MGKLPPLKMGDEGKRVEMLQSALASSGFYRQEITGKYDAGTKAAVDTYKRSQQTSLRRISMSPSASSVEIEPIKIIDDSKDTGVMAPSELYVHEGMGLTEDDLYGASEALGCRLAAIKAVAEVESAGNGFMQPGIPKVLYERHWMYRFLTNEKYRQQYGVSPPANPRMFSNTLLVSKQPGGYKGGTFEWKRFQAAAKEIDKNAAICSTSFGRFQLMGFHWKRLGYGSPVEFFNAMCESESKQLEAFVRFITSDKKLHNALKQQSWTEFAKIYNGPAYAKNRYDSKMAQAFQHHSVYV